MSGQGNGQGADFAEIQDFTLGQDVRVQLVTAGLREVWPELQAGLERVRTASKEPWIAEDVYVKLAQGQAALFTFRRKGELIGFIVLEVMTFPFETERVLSIWIGWAKYPKHGHYGLEAAKRIADGIGFSRVVFSSTQDSPWLDARFKRLHTWYEVK